MAVQGKAAARSEFASRLKSARKKRSLSQAELGRRSGLPSEVISRYESEFGRPSADNLRLICTGLGVSSDYLIGVSDDFEPRSLDPVAAELVGIHHALPARDRDILIELARLLRKRNP